MKQTKAAQFFSDSRIQEAREKILETLRDHQKNLVGVRGPNSELNVHYAQCLKSFSEIRGSKLFFPYLGSGFGNGVFVELGDGSVKYDFISGIGTHYLGHNSPDLMLSAIDAALRGTVLQGNLQQNVESLDVSKLLLSLANKKGASFAHCFLSTSGSMANENALKLIFQKKYPASRILAFEHCFAGRTIVLSHVTDKPSFRNGLPPALPVDYVPFFDSKNPKMSLEKSCSILKNYLSRHPGQHALMMFELIQGEGGYFEGNRDFFLALIHILKENKIAVLFDEIQTFGRTSDPFAFQYYALDEYADVCTVGKLTQVAATLFKKEWNPAPGLLSQTFTANTASLFAAKTILSKLSVENYFGSQGKIMCMHRQFISHFKKLSKRYPDFIQGPFGVGAMIAFTPFKGDADKVKQFAQMLFQNGVIGFVAGANPVRMRFLPPIGAIEMKDVDEVMKILEATLLECAALLPTSP